MPDCAQCRTSFNVTSATQDLFSRLAPAFNGASCPIPEPKLCPSCRWQRRLLFRNERSLYKSKCSLTGKPMISMYPHPAPFPVYYVKEWISDKWDATAYGRDYDFNRPFFDQFAELCAVVPHYSLFVNPSWDENSEYTNCASASKNCYLISQAEHNEDCFYSRGINHCKSCADCLRVDRCELCYEGINLSSCYRCLFSQDCENCSDCYFSSSLRGCSCCFGCHNLSQKQYCFFNEQVSKDEWLSRFRQISLSRRAILHFKEESRALRLTTPHRYARMVHCEECTGDHIQNCREAHEAYDSWGLEYCAYCNEVQNGAQYCQDYSMWGDRAELLYECVGCGHGAYHLLFCSQCWDNVSELIYCESCFPAVRNCFGCYGLHRKEFCILNKQYSKDDYSALVPMIIEQMRHTGEWGEFFPAKLAPFAYNETNAQEYFPVSAAQAAQLGLRWKEEEQAPAQALSAADIPEAPEEVSEAVCGKIFVCPDSGRLHKFIPQEVKLYQALGVSLPTLHHDVRHRQRVAQRNPRRLARRCCESCGEQVATTYPVERPEIVYCERCYLSQV